MTRIETVTIVYQPPRVLLGMKKKRFGAGKYNGFGGEVEDGETLEEAAIRETFEEAGIRLVDARRRGVIKFQFENGEQDHIVHFLRATKYLGEVQESDEMKPEWFEESKIPYDRMWSDDKYWLPLLLAGKQFRGNFQFNNALEIAHYQLKEVSDLR